MHVVPSADGSCRRCDFRRALFTSETRFRRFQTASLKVLFGIGGRSKDERIALKRTPKFGKDAPSCCDPSDFFTQVVAAGATTLCDRGGVKRSDVPVWCVDKLERGGFRTGDAQLLLKIPPWKPPSPPSVSARPLQPSSRP